MPGSTLDSADRDAARLRLEANVVVVAGAGTGKTTLLTDRILFTLLGPERPPSISAVVALTFTEKAAGEIRSRLSERLLELSALVSGGPLGAKARTKAEEVLGELKARFGRKDEEVLGRARAALEDMDKAQIGTIHSFAAHLLRLFPLQSGVDPNFRVDEGARFDELFAGEWARWLDGELGEDAAGSRREEWLAVLRWAPIEDLAELARGLCRERVDLSAAGRPDPATVRLIEDAVRALRLAPNGQPQPRGGSRIIAALSGLCAHLEDLAGAAASPDPPLARPRAAALPQAQWPSAWDAAAQPLYERARRMAACASAANEALLRRACRLILPFAAAFRRTYTRIGLVSFDGLLLKARDLVRDHPSVREELKARFETFLVDEFQDTDPLQGELLLFLAEERAGQVERWDRVKPGAGRLFIVGDPKQSIYRFRGADMAAYQGFTAHLLKDEGTISCDLKTNFRSTAAIIAPVNAIFARLMRHKAGSQPDYLPIAPRHEAGDPGPGVELVAVGPAAEGAAAPDAAAGQKAEAAWIAGWIARHCGPAGRRRFKDAAVLMRTSSALAPLLDAFKAAAIPYVVEMEKLFYGSQEVIDFLNLLRALHDPEDRVCLAGLLRSPLIGLSDADLYRLARAGELSYLTDAPRSLAAPERRRCAKLFARLRGLRGRVGRLPLGDFVHAVMQETPLLEAAARAYHGQQSVSNLLKFARMASSAADERAMTLPEFIGVAAAAMDESRAEGESPLADEHLDAVRILSIHKAKGLEFPVVFVTNLSGASGRGDRDEAVLCDWQSGRAGLRLARVGAADAVRAALDAREGERRQDEAVRLLYVALTRAKERLFLLGREKADKGTLAQVLREAGAWPAPGQESVDLGEAGRLPVRRIRAGADVSRAAGGRGGIKPERRLPPEQTLARLWESRLRRREETAARKWTRSPTEYLRESGKESRWEEKPSSLGPGALVGQVCHQVLAGWDFGQAADPSQAVGEACRLLAASQPEADWEAARREAGKLLKGFLASDAARDLAKAEILGREVPFAYGEAGTVVRGWIDLVYRRGRKVFVADYKTEAVTPASLARLREKYRRQGEDYCAAVERAWGLQGVEFRLLFLRRPGLS